MIILCMHITCWISKATTVHSECVIYIAFLLHWWLPNCISMLHYTYFACLVIIFMIHWWYFWQSPFLFFMLHKYFLLSLLTLFLIRFICFFPHFIFPPTLNLPIGSFSFILYYNPLIQLSLTISAKYTSMK